MNIDQSLIVKNGYITIESIFLMSDGYPQISAFLHECQSQNCTVHFHNEGLTIHPGDLADAGMRAILSTYGMLLSYPKAARDYVNYAFDTAKKKNASSRKGLGR